MRVPAPASSPVGWNCTISMSRKREPRAQRHREAVAALVARGRVVAVHRGTAAGGEQHARRLHEDELALAHVDHRHAGDRAVGRLHELDGAMLLEALDARDPHLLGEAIDDLDAGEVALVHGAVEGLAREGLLVHGAVGIAVEEAAQLVLQLVDALDGLGDERPGELLVGQPLAALDGVHEVALDGIAGREGHVVAALDHARAAALAEQALHRDGDRELRARALRVQRGEEARAAAAQDRGCRCARVSRRGRARGLTRAPAAPRGARGRRCRRCPSPS